MLMNNLRKSKLMKPLKISKIEYNLTIFQLLLFYSPSFNMVRTLRFKSKAVVTSNFTWKYR